MVVANSRLSVRHLIILEKGHFKRFRLNIDSGEEPFNCETCNHICIKILLLTRGNKKPIGCEELLVNIRKDL